MTSSLRYNVGALGGKRVFRVTEGFSFTWTGLPPGLQLPRHAHSKPTLNLVLQGEYTESISGQKRIHGPMTMIGKAAGVEHANSVGRLGASCLVLEVPDDRLAALRADSFAQPAGETGALGLRAVRELKEPDAYSPLILEGIALEIVGVVARFGALREPRLPAWLRQIQDAIHESVRQGGPLPRLEVLGRMAGRHPVYVARAFRRQFGRSVGTYARALRVERARQELVAGYPLSMVAARAGFADQSHFGRVFRRHTGVTPAEFRRRSR